jgi:AraC family transcriptional regulator of adaptative response / DNA-3-methyladenine glycosylase II
VSRALRLIDEGALDRGGIETLASRIGVGPRQLRRLFGVHLGASPLAVARTRRVHFARQLIDETDLPMTQVALGAGFLSVRQFNHAMRSTFGQAPSRLRRKAPAAAAHAAAAHAAAAHAATSRAATGQGLALRLPFRPPFDWAAMVRFLQPRATPGVEAVDLDSYRRTIVIQGSSAVIDVRPDPDRAALKLMLDPPRPANPRSPARMQPMHLIQIVEGVRRIFDLAADPLLIAGHLGRDRRLAPGIRRHPDLRVPGAWDPFELAVRAVLGQEITVRGATTLAGRLVEAFGQRLPGGDAGGLTHLFPSPETLSEITPSRLSRIGMPQARATAIVELAAACAHELKAGAASNHHDAVRRVNLTRIRGIGDWTREIIAMRALGEPDAFPASDLGLRRALANGTGPFTVANMVRQAEAWRPWRAYAAMILWKEDRGPQARVQPPRRSR